MRTDYDETQNLKRYSVKDCPYHANKDEILKSINEIKSIHKLLSLKSETDDGLSSCSNFPECPSSYELETDKPVLPEIEQLKGKIGEGDFELLRAVLNRNADVFSKYKRILVAVTSSNTKSKLRKVLFPTGKAQDRWRHINRKRAERKLKCCSNTT